MATPLTLGVTTDVGAVANFLDECVKAGIDILAVWDSPQMIQARANAAKQKDNDQNAKDVDATLSTGNTDAIDKDLT